MELAMQQEFDIVLLDEKMPGKRGMEIIEPLREIHPRIKIVLHTGHATVDLVVEAMKAGADDLLRKPLDADELSSLIESLGGLRAPGLGIHEAELHENPSSR